MTTVRKFKDYRWDQVDRLDYKQTGTHFREINRQLLFDAPDGLRSQLRYFEISPGGHSTLEKHAHPHAVMVLRGRGRALADGQIHALEPFDLLTTPPWTWHQFRSDPGETFGFLCLVDIERDRPTLPSAADLEALAKDYLIAEFIRP